MQRRGTAREARRDGAVIIDSFGRPWRRGTTGVAIGAPACRRCSTCAAIPTCSAARCRSPSPPSPTSRGSGVAGMGQADEAQPVVLVRGLSWKLPATNAAELVRPPSEDLFR